ncbi:MAG: hypothetical protein Q9162_000412 [Coniocarpon cinnabarinum]
MVTTRGSTKSAALPQPPSPSETPSTVNPKSLFTKPKQKDASDSRKSELLQTQQPEEVISSPAPRKITGKRKRASGAREDPHVSALSRDIELNEDADAEPLSEDVDRPTFHAEAIKDFLAHLKKHAKCQKCGADLERSLELRAHVESRCPPPIDGTRDAYNEQVSGPAMLSSSHCPSNFCHAMTCLGCGLNIGLNSASQPHNHCLYGCPGGWYVSLWLQLAYAGATRAPPTDAEFVDARSRRSSAKSNASKASRHSNRPPVPAGTGYASGNPSLSEVDEGKTRTQAALEEKRADMRDTMIFTVIADLLANKPSIDAQDEEIQPPTRRSKYSQKPRLYGDSLKPPYEDSALIPSLFHWSGVLESLARLFRNDSLEEAHKRQDVYDAALRLVDVLLTFDGRIAELITRKTFNAVKALDSVSTTTFTMFPVLVKSLDEDNTLTPSRVIDFEGPSIAESMDNILMACETLSNAAAKMPRIYKDRSSRDMLYFASRFQNIGKRVGRDVTQQGISNQKSTDSLPQASSSHNRFEMIDEAEITNRFMRHKEVGFKLSSTSSNQRMRTLHKEVGMLRTSLPPGIWVKMASNRPDIMKALIVGPEGTPYEAGLFEFDIFCPKDYPRTPPKVECATAARDEARPFSLNPNLYNTGYVCLSVINTWHGAKQEQWQPGQSTLLQVLISIQSMVLGTATPADNEPGGLGISHKDYNRSVHPGTIKAALLPWLNAEELRRGVWKSEIEDYFKANATQILETVRQWGSDNKRITAYQSHSYVPAIPPNAFIPVHLAVPPVPTPSTAVPAVHGNIPALPQIGANPPANAAASATASETTTNHPSHAGANSQSVDVLLSNGQQHGHWSEMAGSFLNDQQNMEHPEDVPLPLPPPPPHISDAELQAFQAIRSKGPSERPKPINLVTELEKALKEFL